MSENESKWDRRGREARIGSEEEASEELEGNTESLSVLF